MYDSISSPNAPAAIGPYSPGIKLGDFVYLSGQLPIDPMTNELVSDDIQQQTYQVIHNIEAILSEMNLELRHIVKTTVYLTDMNDFDGMNQIYATVLSEPYPARTTVGVAALPKGAKVEIECLVIDTLAYEAAAHQHHHHHDHDHECSCGHDHHHDHDHDHDHESCNCEDGTCG